jgi:hypothetical protein
MRILSPHSLTYAFRLDFSAQAILAQCRKALFHAGFSDQSPCYSPDNVHAHFAASREAVEPPSRFQFAQNREEKRPCSFP